MYPGQMPMQQNPWAQMFMQLGGRDGRIDVQELQRGLSQGGFQFDIAVADKLMCMFNRDTNGPPGLDMNEFGQLMNFVKQMADAFRAQDRDRGGTLDGNEVRAALAASGYQLSEPVFQTVMKKMDKNRRGCLTFDQYILLSILIGNTRNTFAYYDQQSQPANSVTFNFDSFFGAVVAAAL